MYELPHELSHDSPNDLALRIIRKEEILENVKNADIT